MRPRSEQPIPTLILRDLADGPATKHDLSETTGIHPRNLLHYIRLLHADGKIRVGRLVTTEKNMRIETAEDAIDAYTGQDAWKFADREAAWKWMFEAGRKSAMNTCYRLAMAASEPAKGGSFNDGKWAVADAIKMRSANCDCATCTCQPED